MTNKLVGQSELAIRDSKQQQTITLLFCKGGGEFLKKLWSCVGEEVVYKNLII